MVFSNILFSNIPKKLMIRVGVITFIWSIMNIGFVKILSILIKEYSDSNPSIAIIVGYFGFLVLWEVLEYTCKMTQSVIYSYIENNIRAKVIEETNNLKPEVIKQYNTGYINGVVGKYINHKIVLYDCLMLYAPISIIYVGYFVYSMWQYHFAYGLALIGLVLGSFVLKFILTSVEESKKLTELESQRDKITIDTISNIGTIQKMQCKDFIISKVIDANNKCLAQTKVWTRKNEASFALYKLLMYSYLPITLLIYHFIPVENKTEFFSFLSIICVQIVHTAQLLTQTLVNAIKYNASLKKLREIYCEDHIRRPLINMSEFRTAQMMNVEYEYKNDDKTVSIKIPYFQLTKGDRVCLYGESGQGKSTLLNILSGEIETNDVIVNGQSDTNGRLECVFIAQDTEILDMSLRDNLTLGRNNIDDNEIIDLLYKCGLGDWYEKQSKGLDTLLGERGVFVSTGQRQRLNIIRGLLIKDKEIYLLDEPTSNVDDETEDKLIKVIEKYLMTKTIVIVTHRPKIKNICNKGYKFTNGVLGKAEKF